MERERAHCFKKKKNHYNNNNNNNNCYCRCRNYCFSDRTECRVIIITILSLNTAVIIDRLPLPSRSGADTRWPARLSSSRTAVVDPDVSHAVDGFAGTRYWSYNNYWTIKRCLEVKIIAMYLLVTCALRAATDPGGAWR